MHLNFATQGIYMWAIGLVKISIGLFLLRFAPRKGYKIFIWVIIGKLRLLTGHGGYLLTGMNACSAHAPLHNDLFLGT